MNSLAREIPRGTIYDRNGIPAGHQQLGGAGAPPRGLRRRWASRIDQAGSRFDNRHYPFGAAAAHVLGDLRTGENFHATNASLVEHDSNTQAAGLRVCGTGRRWCATAISPAIRRSRGCWRATATCSSRSISGCRLRAKEILEQHLRDAHNQNGAVVVMDAATGDVLALVSAPAPDPPGSRPSAPSPDELLDRARYGAVSAGLDLQAGDRDRGAARQSRAEASHLPVPHAARRPRGQHDRRLEPAHQRRYRRPRPRHARHGARHHGFLQRLLRAVGRARCGVARRWRRRPRSWASPPAIRRSCARRCRSPPTGRARC